MKRIMWTVAMLPLIAAVFVLQYMPDSVPMHYNASGSIDRWGSKYEILILPASILGVALLFQIIIMVYEKKISESSDEKDKIRLSSNLKVMKIVSITVSLVFGVMCGFIMYNTWSVAKGNMDSQAVDMMKITAILMGVMLIVLGNFMPKTKRNHMVGMRIKWSLYNYMAQKQPCCVHFYDDRRILHDRDSHIYRCYDLAGHVDDIPVCGNYWFSNLFLRCIQKRDQC